MEEIKGTFVETLVDCLAFKHELMMIQSLLVEQCDEHYLDLSGLARLLGPWYSWGVSLQYLPLVLWASLEDSILVSCDDLTEELVSLESPLTKHGKH